MKEIIFIRHAKSDWANETIKDADRFLSERGYSDAYQQSEWYLKEKSSPDLILSSTAIRALSTALIFARTLNFGMKNFRLEQEIYEAKPETVISIIKKQDNKLNSILLFGHNPAFTEVCNQLSDELFFDNIPTCGIVSFSFNVNNWTELKLKKGKLNYFRFPKDYRNKD